eukprot:CAMPEP_0115858584 /NCGR_PEP_ID=MMETSP0287-20121206/16174_1 /TAXON_ID=412157 /ORGANISM="Chrysochromulina rotalis, Strain UIO044" /LENGTH=361 /DNA_ID=CAMNT_0003312855 /DNA_START=114 /DNA_END=1199 /DNA_ORIENTATION=+
MAYYDEYHRPKTLFEELGLDDDLFSDPIPVAVMVGVLTFILWSFYWPYHEARKPHVTAIYIYPIKSCAAIEVPQSSALARGFEGDRIFQCTDRNGKYCTPRDEDKSKLLKVQPDFVSSSKILLKAEGVPTTYTIDLKRAEKDTPTVDAEVLCCLEKLPLLDFGDEAAAWLEESTGITGVRLTGMPSKCQRFVRVNPDQGDPIPTRKDAPVSLADEAPYLLTSQSSLDDLNKRLKARGKPPVDMRRFRPNIVVQGLKPWEEDGIKKVQIGEVEFWAWQRCGRCTMTTIDRDTLERGPEPLATLSTFRERANGQRNFGMHLVPVERAKAAWGGYQTMVEKNAKVVVLEWHEERREEWQQQFGR